MYRHLLPKICSLITLLTLSVCSFSQTGIAGAKCVVTGLEYQYDIKGEWKENDKISICVDGGVLVENNSKCLEKETISFVRIKWTEGKTTGKITVASKAGTTNLAITITSPLNPGVIETSTKQTLNTNNVPASIRSTAATGGSCSPAFSYQWEQSVDRFKWTLVNGATGKDLSLKTPLLQSTFFRRKVVEKKSNHSGYTNIVAVFVLPKTN